MKTNFIGILLLGVSILFSACHKEEQLAILNTAAITSITDSSAVSGGQILESRVAKFDQEALFGAQVQIRALKIMQT